MVIVGWCPKKQQPSSSYNLSAASITTICLLIVNIADKMVVAGVDHCYSDIGCFPLSDQFYHPRHRPFNVRPWHRRHIRTQFELFNGHHPRGYTLVPWNKLNLLHSTFDPRLETKIIIPGWLDNIDRAVWVKQLKDALLWLWKPSNIIVVRWRNFTPYTIATANTRVVGAELANLIRFLEHELGYDPTYYHLIGHSLGAHIGGYCGDRVPGLGRITALDPARPFFQGMPKVVRLDRGDAKFVDVIHSDFTPENAIFLLMSFGATTPIGHVDFYPNGPPLLQPGCLRDTLLSVQRGIVRGLEHSSLSVAFLEATRYLTACDHQRSHEWFIESIVNRECVFVGVRCNEFEGMINGRCTCDDSPSACAIMGIHADQMYLNNVHEDIWPVNWGGRQVGGVAGVVPEPVLQLQPPPIDDATIDSSGADKMVAAMLSPQQLGRPPSRQEIYAQLTQQAAQMRHPPEPSIVGLDDYTDDYFEAAATQDNGQYETIPRALSMGDQQQQQQYSDTIEQETLQDSIFIEYLRKNLLIDPPRQQQQQQQLYERPKRQFSANMHDNLHFRKRSDSSSGGGGGGGSTKQASGELDATKPLNGHIRLMSEVDDDIEDWYEQTSRWYLKTNNRPNYCSNQYQVMVFLGPLKASRGRDRLRANLIISIIGTRGRLMNQRFVPRSSSLDSFTMQPFFILLEGSYSLGQIESVAVAWEARHEPDPVQATITFKSNPLESVQMHVPALRARHPWLSETIKYDKSAGYQAALLHRPAPAHYQQRPAQRRSRGKHEQGSFGRLGGGNSPTAEAEPLAGIKLSRNVATTKNDNHHKHHQQAPRHECPSTKLNAFRPNGPAQHCSRPHHKQAAEVYKQTSGLTVDSLVPAIGQHYDFLGELEQLASDRDSAQVAPILAAAQSRGHKQLLQPGRELLVAAEAHARRSRPSEPIVEVVDVMEPSDSFLVPLLDRPPGTVLARPLDEHDYENQLPISLELHNIELHHELPVEDSIVINQVIVSPLQAGYGRTGRTVKSFCPPRANYRLRRDQTVRMMPSLIGKCSHH